MGHYRKSDGRTPEFMVRVHADVSRRFSVSDLHHNDRFATWEDDDIGVPPVETTTSFQACSAIQLASSTRRARCRLRWRPP